MDIFLDILIGLSMLAVVGSLFMGMLAFSKNASGDRSSAWMAWRVRTQVIAIGVLMLSVWWKASHGA
jgi:hypothetical protein